MHVADIFVAVLLAAVGADACIRPRVDASIDPYNFRANPCPLVGADPISARAASAKRSSIVFGRMAPVTDAALTPEQITGKRTKES